MEEVDKNQTIDETKRKLQESREKLEGELEFQLQDIKRDAADFGKQLLIVGGGIYVGWKILKSLSSSKKKKKEKKKTRYHAEQKKSSGPGFGQMLMHQLVTMAVVAISDEVKKAFNKDKAIENHQRNT